MFKGYSPIEPPGYSVFRKALKGENFNNLTLQILLLKCEGHKFPRNPNAHPFELHCETLFYGPLVVATNSKEQPYSLSDFTLEDLEALKDLNQRYKKVQPNPMDLTNHKKCLPDYHPIHQALRIDVIEENTKLQFVMQMFNTG